MRACLYLPTLNQYLNKNIAQITSGSTLDKYFIFENRSSHMFKEDIGLESFGAPFFFFFFNTYLVV